MRRLVHALPSVALFAALALVLLLARQNRALADRTGKLQKRAFEPYAGPWVPTVETRTLDGLPLTLGEHPGGRRQLLLVFTTTCEFCRASLPSWRRLAAVADTMREPPTQVVGVVLDSGDAEAYRRTHDLRFPIARFPTRRAESMYRVRSVPLIFVLDPNGQAIYSRVGVLSEPSEVDSVIAALRWRRPVPDALDSGSVRLVPRER